MGIGGVKAEPVVPEKVESATEEASEAAGGVAAKVASAAAAAAEAAKTIIADTDDIQEHREL